METSTQQIIKERFAQLPKLIREAIHSTDLPKKLKALTEKHKLHLDQASALELEVSLIMLGLEPAKDILKNLQENLSIPFEQARTLASDIDLEIFKEIKDEIIKMNEDEAEQEESTEDLTKEKVLAEIETPAPTISPVIKAPSITTQTSTPIITKEVGNILEQKLSTMVQFSHQSLEQKEGDTTKKEEPTKPVSYTSDPYKEPINL